MIPVRYVVRLCMTSRALPQGSPYVSACVYVCVFVHVDVCVNACANFRLPVGFLVFEFVRIKVYVYVYAYAYPYVPFLRKWSLVYMFMLFHGNVFARVITWLYAHMFAYVKVWFLSTTSNSSDGAFPSAPPRLMGLVTK